MPAAAFADHALSKTYQMGEVAVVALRDIDLEIYEGEFLVLLGPSGSGKSTLLNMGLKGMRVWDFGSQPAERGWHAERDLGEIRLLMPATDLDYPEQRLDRAASQGCIRIPATMNRFLEVHGVLDADYERAAQSDSWLLSILLPDRQPSSLAGNALVVLDSSEAFRRLCSHFMWPQPALSRIACGLIVASNRSIILCHPR